MTTLLSVCLLLLLELLVPATLLYSQSTDEEDFVELEDFVDEDEFSMKPRFSRPSSGGGVTLGFNLTALKPSVLDPSLKGDLVLRNIDLYFVHNGLLLGGSWTTSTLYDAPDNYDEFDFGYRGVMLGYEQGLYYGRLKIRPSIFLGQMGVKLIKSRPDITFDTILNPSRREVLERVWEDESFMLRPAFGIGFWPIDLVQLRVEAGFLYPMQGRRWEELREPIYSFQFVFGSNR